MKLQKFFRLIWEKCKRFCLFIWEECKDIKTLFLLFAVILVVYTPVWLGYLLFFLFRWDWVLVVATACLAFWAGPFTPFFPLCIAITLGIKKIWKRVKSRNDE